MLISQHRGMNYPTEVFYREHRTLLLERTSMSRLTLSFGLLAVLGLTACYVYTAPPAGHAEPASSGKPAPATQSISPQALARISKLILPLVVSGGARQLSARFQVFWRPK